MIQRSWDSDFVQNESLYVSNIFLALPRLLQCLALEMNDLLIGRVIPLSTFLLT